MIDAEEYGYALPPPGFAVAKAADRNTALRKVRTFPPSKAITCIFALTFRFVDNEIIPQPLCLC